MIFHLTGSAHVVRRSRFTKEQIEFGFKQAELGTKVEGICRRMCIGDAAFCKWRQKYAGLWPSELRRRRQLEEEYNKLQRLVADLSLDMAILKDVLSDKL
jgi:putative transposase